MITEEQLAKIRLLALDVDGVLTDGSIIIGQEGELSKHFDARDGMGISLALRHGIQVALITGRHSEIVLHRAMELGISSVYENVVFKGKGPGARPPTNWIFPLEETAFMGDDLNDLPAFSKAAVTLGSGGRRLRKSGNGPCWYLPAQEGHGAVRDVIERILKAKGTVGRNHPQL
ncbi:KdsC family phosphatase [Acidaminococcus fermentans]|uniref:KdsC family phosphatase n=1 Tax=Acidaminococcus fermentans TaxID=905 RepID=UPI00242022F0|nr:3-deoxy-D-manno-octulosonate 8-phosphate phosphatase [Acidaminococcus fermentans]